MEYPYIVILFYIIDLSNIILNSIIVYSLRKLKKTNIISYWLLYCLSISDIFVGISSLIPHTLYVTLDPSSLDEKTLILPALPLYFFIHNSGILIFVVAIDRSIRLRYLHKYNTIMTWRKAYILVSSCCISAALLAVAITVQLMNSGSLAYILSVTRPSLFILFIIIISISYILIYVSIRKRVWNQDSKKTNAQMKRRCKVKSNQIACDDEEQDKDKKHGRLDGSDSGKNEMNESCHKDEQSFKGFDATEKKSENVIAYTDSCGKISNFTDLPASKNTSGEGYGDKMLHLLNVTQENQRLQTFNFKSGNQKSNLNGIECNVIAKVHHWDGESGMEESHKTSGTNKALHDILTPGRVQQSAGYTSIVDTKSVSKCKLVNSNRDAEGLTMQRIIAVRPLEKSMQEQALGLSKKDENRKNQTVGDFQSCSNLAEQNQDSQKTPKGEDFGKNGLKTRGMFTKLEKSLWKSTLFILFSLLISYLPVLIFSITKGISGTKDRKTSLILLSLTLANSSLNAIILLILSRELNKYVRNLIYRIFNRFCYQ